jgi:phosphatidylserine/phosphatidylglycerophosphate/cardiolipin synthase-like enzyme
MARTYADPESRVELALTLPSGVQPREVSNIPHRTTLGALVELIAQADVELIVASPFMRTGPRLLGHNAVYEAVKAALLRGVMVHIFSLERNVRAPGLSDLQSEQPAGLHLYCTSTAGEQPWLGSHAKLCIADGRKAYVGSANLTRAGLSENVEVGLLIEGAVAEHLRATWAVLLEHGVFVPLS